MMIERDEDHGSMIEARCALMLAQHDLDAADL